MWAPANDNGCRFGHHCPWWVTDYIKMGEVDRNKLISPLFIRYYHVSLMGSLAQPLPQVART